MIATAPATKPKMGGVLPLPFALLTRKLYFCSQTRQALHSAAYALFKQLQAATTNRPAQCCHVERPRPSFSSRFSSGQRSLTSLFQHDRGEKTAVQPTFHLSSNSSFYDQVSKTIPFVQPLLPALGLPPTPLRSKRPSLPCPPSRRDIGQPHTLKRAKERGATHRDQHGQ